MDQAMEDRVKVMITEAIREADLVGRKFCIERHAGVKTLEEKVKSLDSRLWGLIVLAIAQLGGLVAILIK